MQVKILSFLYILLFTFFFGSSNIIAQTWQSLNGPLESDIRDIVITNDSIYVAAYDPGGLFKRAQNVDQWLYSEIVEGTGAFRQVIDGLLSIEIGQDGMYYAGGGGIASIGDGKVTQHFFKSNDFGETWNEFISGIEYSGSISDIKLLSSNNLLISGAGGIFKIDNKTNSFTKMASSFVSYGFFGKGDTLWSGNYDGAMYSTDSGITWLNSGPDSLKIKAITFANGHYFFGSDKGLYTSTGIEQQWDLIKSTTSTSIHSLFTYNNQVIVGTESGAYIFDESIDNLHPIFPDISTHKIQVITAHNNDIYIGTNRGLFVCNLIDNNCDLDGVPNSIIQGLVTQNDTLLVNSTQNIYRYFISENAWDTAIIPENLRIVVPHLKDSVYAIDLRHFYRCSFITQQCSNTRVEEPGNALLSIAKTNEQIFTSSTRRVFQSSDNGESWTTIIEASPRTFYNLSVFEDSLLFISGSTNLKYNIETQSFDTLSKSTNLITQDGTLYSATMDGVHKSVDFGETWTEILSSFDYLTDGTIRKILYDETSEKLYVVTTVGRVYVTKNGGINWGVNEEMYPIYIESATIGGNGILYLGTGKAGVFSNTQPLNPPITISNEEEPSASIPKKFILHQNYPNPFNPSTTVPFDLTHPTEVSLTLYNLFGQKVKKYNLGYKNSGHHQQIIEFHEQASGVYLLRLKAGDNSQTIKISFIK